MGSNYWQSRQPVEGDIKVYQTVGPSGSHEMGARSYFYQLGAMGGVFELCMQHAHLKTEALGSSDGQIAERLLLFMREY